MFFDPRFAKGEGVEVVFSTRPMEGYKNIFIEKKDFEAFKRYCEKAGVEEKEIKKIYKMSGGYIENARHYIREFKRYGGFKENPERFIIASFFTSSIKYFFYTIGWYKIGNIFGAMSYFFMMFYFIRKVGRRWR